MTSTTTPAPRVNTQRRIPLDRIDRNPEQPRTEFAKADLEGLASSLREVGQQVAITVRYLPATRRYQIVSGERRWRAANMAGLTHLYAMVVDGIDEEDTYVRAVVENVTRADMTPLEEARAFKRLVDAGYTIDRISSICGKTVEYVGWRIDLLGLVPGARDAVAKGHLPVGVAWYVCRLSSDLQHRFLAKWGRGEFSTASDAAAFAQACRTTDAQTSLFLVEEPSMIEREQLVADRRRVTTKVDQLSRAGEILSELANMDPTVLARLLGGATGGVPAYQARISHLHTAAGKAVAKLRKAAAVAAAAELHINPDAVPDAA